MRLQRRHSKNDNKTIQNLAEDSAEGCRAVWCMRYATGLSNVVLYRPLCVLLTQCCTCKLVHVSCATVRLLARRAFSAHSWHVKALAVGLPVAIETACYDLLQRPSYNECRYDYRRMSNSRTFHPATFYLAIRHQSNTPAASLYDHLHVKKLVDYIINLGLGIGTGLISSFSHWNSRLCGCPVSSSILNVRGHVSNHVSRSSTYSSSWTSWLIDWVRINVPPNTLWVIYDHYSSTQNLEQSSC